MHQFIYRGALTLAAVWTVYCAVDLWWVLGHVDQVLLPRLRAQGLHDLPPVAMQAARDGFTGAYMQTRLAWWASITVVLMLLALVIRPRTHG